MTITSASEKDIPIIGTIAEKTWWPTYSSILPAEQLRYMLEAIYSEDSLKKVMTDGSQEFIMLSDEGEIKGFASFGRRIENPFIFKLHKLYVLPGTHGKGFGKALLEEVKERIKNYLPEQPNHQLDLNVNRYNPARNFYEKAGFTIEREEDVPIGPYWMNDFVMKLTY
jgi:ribosomal protein S18 acetylase RimI-like enzyme